MRLLLERPNVHQPLELEDGLHLLGGGPKDQPHLADLEPGLCRLRVEPGRALLTARRAVLVNGLPTPANVERLLLPGDVITLGARIHLRIPKREERPPPSTGLVVRALLTSGDPGTQLHCPSLLRLTGPELGHRTYLTDAPTLLGRGGESAVRLRDRSVSRSHARLRRHNGSTFLQPLDTPNGVFLNGAFVQGEVELRVGDVLEVGRTLLKLEGPSTLELLKDPTSSATDEDLPEVSTDPGARSLAGRLTRSEGWLILGATVLACLTVLSALTVLARTQSQANPARSTNISTSR
jgi:pSer/pThr/pTyr-binding forkhead associated (FHA) protein